MSIIKFVKDEENCECLTCEIVDNYFDAIVEADSEEELFYLLNDLVREGKILGVKEYLIRDIDDKMELFNELSYCDCCEDDCDECKF